MLSKNAMMNMPIVLLKDGVDDCQGTSHIIANIQAASGVASIIKNTLGPKGTDKLIHNEREVTISNDGATILRKLNIEHPAARIMCDISVAQDQEVGDGTTSVVVLCSELLNEVKSLIEEGLHPRTIIKGFYEARELALSELEKTVLDISGKTDAERREIYLRCACTTLNSKLLGGVIILHFAELAIATCEHMGSNLSLDNTDVKKVIGGSATESMVINGCAFPKTFSFAGFEMNQKSYQNPKILVLNHELELKAERDNAEARIKNPGDYQSIINAEWDILYNKLIAAVECGAQIVISKLAIGDVATQFFADRGVFCAGRVNSADANRVATISGAKIQTSFLNLDSSILGTVKSFEEIQIGKERYNIFHAENSPCCTVILRGGGAQFLDEAERSYHDAMCVVKRCMETQKVVPGGGAADMAISTVIRNEAMKISGKKQMIYLAFAKAFEIIPRTLALNSGADPTLTLNQLRAKYNERCAGDAFYGVDCMGADIITDTLANYIWEPMLIKRNTVVSAVEAACILLSIDETVRHPPSRQPDGPNAS